VDLTAKCFPRLLTGIVRVDLADADNFYLGDLAQGLFLPRKLYPAIAFLSGEFELSEIATALSCSSQELFESLSPLFTHNLLEFLSHPIQSEPVDHSALLNWHWQRAEIGFEEFRDLASVSALARLPTSERISARSEMAITIFGRNRLSLALLQMLLASGFNQSSLHHWPYPWTRRPGEAKIPKRYISGEAITSIAIRAEDYGRVLSQIEDELRAEANLVTRASTSRFAGSVNNSRSKKLIPTLAIATTVITPDFAQRWLAQDEPHLLVRFLTPYLLQLGPLVIPGQTPCANCAELGRQDLLPGQLALALATVSDQWESGVTQTQLAAALICQEMLRISAGESSELLGQVLHFDLRAPIGTAPRVQRLSMHPDCGCGDLLSSSADVGDRVAS
jgi:hypothetical protein